jgi:hypothetical protein
VEVFETASSVKMFSKSATYILKLQQMNRIKNRPFCCCSKIQISDFENILTLKVHIKSCLINSILFRIGALKTILHKLGYLSPRQVNTLLSPHPSYSLSNHEEKLAAIFMAFIFLSLSLSLMRYSRNNFRVLIKIE